MNRRLSESEELAFRDLASAAARLRQAQEMATRAAEKQVAELRRAVRNCGKTPYRVAKDAGLPPSVVYRFLSGTDPTLTTMDKIIAGAGIEVYLRKA